MPFKCLIVEDKVVMKRTDKENAVKIITLPVSVRKIILRAIRIVQGKNGATFKEIRNYFDHGLSIRVPVRNVEIKMALQKTVTEGIIVKKGGFFKLCSRGRKLARQGDYFIRRLRRRRFKAGIR